MIHLDSVIKSNEKKNYIGNLQEKAWIDTWEILVGHPEYRRGLCVVQKRDVNVAKSIWVGLENSNLKDSMALRLRPSN